MPRGEGGDGLVTAGEFQTTYWTTARTGRANNSKCTHGCCARESASFAESAGRQIATWPKDKII